MLEDKVVELRNLLSPEDMAASISMLWHDWHNERRAWQDEKKELRNYIFATDTSTTSNATLDWKNKTTTPKLCQIRDNLHANYKSALFPNDDWLKWEGYTLDDEEQSKRAAIEAYMSNKVREGNFRDIASQLLYDYIDFGIAIADTIWVNDAKEDPSTGELIPGYVGPKLVRVSPLDIVFDPTAVSLDKAPKVTRSIKRFGELELQARYTNDEVFRKAIAATRDIRNTAQRFTVDDFDKASGFTVDGFGNLYEYYGSGYVEILEFEGSMHDGATGEFLDDYIITVIDRTHVIRKEKIPAWKRGGFKVAATWRKRPDNLYGMGPLDNLVGMQYRIDHLENLKADIGDMILAPPLKVRGDVEDFEWRPFAQIEMGEDGDIESLSPDARAFQANSEIDRLMDLMEEMAGAPKQAMGIRTPGEKTAFEVQALENAAGRIFQEKIVQFETELVEPILNNMIMLARHKMDGADVLRVMDNDLGVADFISITKEDITAKGKVRPIAARHFSARAQLLQNLTGVANSPIWAKIEKHISDKQLAKLVEDSLQLARFSLVSDNVAVFENAETQRLLQQSQEDVEVEALTPIEEDIPDEPPLA